MSDIESGPVTLGPDFIQDPHPIYARLRERGPAHRVVLPNGLTAWLVTSYDEGRALLADARLSKSMQDAEHLFERHQADTSRQRNYSHLIQRSMINMEPPDHTRLRSLVTRAFTVRQVERLRPRIEQITDELLGPLTGRSEFDVVGDFATPMVGTVIAELLGVPEDERDEFRERTAVLTSDSDRQALADASDALLAQVGDLVRKKREALGDDLISSLIQASDGADRLSWEELLSTTVLLLAGGFDTTVNLIGNGVLALLRHPDQMAALRADPSLIPNAVEELLRFDGPATTSHFRRTLAPVPVGNVTIPADEFVFVGIASANRDADRFTDPDGLDVRRTHAGHLAFGHGIHHCVGAPLARIEGEIAFRKFIAHFPSLTLAADTRDLVWRSSTLHHGLEELHVRQSTG